MRARLALVAPALVALMVAVVAIAAATAADAGSPAPALLPDLEQEVPAGLVITRDRGEHRLGFRSAVRNVGDGPLVIDGRRRSQDEETMVADQVVSRRGGGVARTRDVGRLRFVTSPDHRHWHLLGFERYELRRAGSAAAAVTDRKTGFCLGDRYVAGGPVSGARAPRPVFRSRCGLDARGLLRIREGISVGHGDDYEANLEGQHLPLTGLASGEYVLTHRVNGDRRMRETRYANNVASVRLRLTWRSGVPSARILRRCPASASCAA